MEFAKKPNTTTTSSTLSLKTTPASTPAPDPQLERQRRIRQSIQRLMARPVSSQQKAAQPALRAANLYSEEVKRQETLRQTLQREATDLGSVSQEAIRQAIQRQQQVAPQVPLKPQNVGDWVTVMRFQAEQAEGRRMGAKEAAQFTALQRQVAQTLTQHYLHDRQPALQRQQEYAEHVLALQRHPMSGQVGRAFLLSVPQGERPALQRAVDDALQRQAEQQVQDQAALKLHSLQRQIAELEQEATQPVFERIQQRRGAGNPLPEAIQRHLEQGLNHDLSAVRIHDDAEADKLAKGVNAIAFTTGADIYFQSGKFNPNSQSGLELLAHEVTHTVQQSKGQVGKGVDPDAGLESEARAIGAKLSTRPFRLPCTSTRRPVSTLRHSIGISASLSVQRYAGANLLAKSLPADYFLKGSGPQWGDAGTAAHIAVDALPARLKAHYAGMPAQLLAGTIEFLKITVGGLAFGTIAGGMLGAFFGGPAGAVLGASAGYEAASFGLAAWGLGFLIAGLKTQIAALQGQVSAFATCIKQANGKPEKIQQASEHLIQGMTILCDGVLSGVAALLLHKGFTAFKVTKVGQKIGAVSEQSASVQWLKERQKMSMTKERVVPKVTSLVQEGLARGRRLMGVTERLNKKGIRLASGVEKGIDLPTDALLAKQAIQVGTVKMKLHPQYNDLIQKIRSYGFEIVHKKGVAYVENIQRVNPDFSQQSVRRVLTIDEEARFMDLRHEYDHILQLMEVFKGNLWTRREIQNAKGSWKPLKETSNDKPKASGKLMIPNYFDALELHVRLKEFFRLKSSGADEGLLAEHAIGLEGYMESFLKAQRNGKKWDVWALTNFPDLKALIEDFKPIMGKY